MTGISISTETYYSSFRRRLFEHRIPHAAMGPSAVISKRAAKRAARALGAQQGADGKASPSRTTLPPLKMPPPGTRVRISPQPLSRYAFFTPSSPLICSWTQPHPSEHIFGPGVARCEVRRPPTRFLLAQGPRQLTDHDGLAYPRLQFQIQNPVSRGPQHRTELLSWWPIQAWHSAVLPSDQQALRPVRRQPCPYLSGAQVAGAGPQC